VVKHALAEAGDKDVFIAIPIVVGDRDPLAVNVSGKSGLLGDVGVGAITVVAIEHGMQRNFRLVETAGAGIYQQNIHPSVVVVIEDRDPGSGRFRQVVLVRQSAGVLPGNSTLAWWNLAKNRIGRDRKKAGGSEQKHNPNQPAPQP